MFLIQEYNLGWYRTMGPLQVASHVVQKHLAGEQETHWGKTIFIFKYLFIYLVIVLNGNLPSETPRQTEAGEISCLIFEELSLVKFVTTRYILPRCLYY